MSMLRRAADGIGQFTKAWRNRRLAERLKKNETSPDLDHKGYVLIGDTAKPNGLSRAYRYESDRLSAEGLLSKSSRNFLILGQPRHYRKILASPPPGFKDGYRIGLWVTEFETFPTDWLFALDLVHEIWTPSSFSERAIRAVTNLPVKVIPHAVRVEDGPSLDRSCFGVQADQFLGLAIMDLGTCPDRKNPLAHIAAWRQAFGDVDRVHLLMKIRIGRNTEFMRTAIHAALKGVRNISLVEEMFNDEDISAFQRMGDVYLSLHRSEGYGLNIHEMLERGTPAIATGYSGNMDFMPRYPHARTVPFHLVPYSDRTRHYRDTGLQWAEPNIAAAAELLRAERNKWKARRCAASN